MKKSFKVDSSYFGIRIDKWIRNNLGKVPQSLIEKNLRFGKIKLNNRKIKSSTKLNKNDLIEVFDLSFDNRSYTNKKSFDPSGSVVKQSEKLIIYNNDDFVVVNKESGVAVQGGTKSKKNLIDIFSKSKLFNENKPYSVHRLDKDTSGVFIIAKNRETAKLLTTLFRLRKIHKTYLAICYGELNDNKGVLDQNLIKLEGKKKIVEDSKTLFSVLYKNSNYSLLKLNPITGRKHQLRKQLSLIGHPIYGDNKYVIDKRKNVKRKKLMLHSYKIKFMLSEKKYTFNATLPKYFKDLIKSQRIKFEDF